MPAAAAGGRAGLEDVGRHALDAGHGILAPVGYAGHGTAFFGISAKLCRTPILISE
jgi:hypothetical protein